MTYKMFSVYDSKAEAYAMPFFMNTVGEALRGFMEVSNDPSSSICRHPADFTLFELGEFDNQGCEFVLHATPKNLGIALEMKKASAAEAANQPPLPLVKGAR